MTSLVSLGEAVGLVGRALVDAVVVAGQRAGDRPHGLVGGAEDVLAVCAGRDVDGDDQRGGLAGHVQAQGAAEGLDAADDAAGGVGENDGIHAGDVDAFGDQAGVGEDRAVGGGEGVGALGGGVLAVGEEQLGGDVRDEAGVGAGQQAQGVREFAGKAAGVGDEVEVDQDLAQAVFGHGAQNRQVQGGGAQRAVLLITSP